jgi:hypothetical protein
MLGVNRCHHYGQLRMSSLDEYSKVTDAQTTEERLHRDSTECTSLPQLETVSRRVRSKVRRASCHQLC